MKKGRVVAAKAKSNRSVPMEENQVLKERSELMSEVFDMFDSENNGYVNADNVESLIKAMGKIPSASEVENILKKADKKNNGSVEKNAFFQAFEEEYSLPEDKRNEVIEAFKIFDKNNNGKISLLELKNILLKYCNDFTEEECDEIFGLIDTNNSGEISYKEFVDMWKMQ